MSRQIRLALVTLVLAALTTPIAAQTLYVMDGTASGAVLHQESIPSGAPCAQPNPLGLPVWPYIVPPPCAGPPLGPVVGPGFGDIAVDRTTDHVYVTDGLAVGEYTGDPACPAAPGVMLNSYTLPPIPSPFSPGGFMSPLSGMAIDPVAGILWVCDPWTIVGLVGYGAPAGSCPALVVAIPPFAPGVLIPGIPSMTDLTWDPTTGTLWVIDIGTLPGTGFVHNVAIGGATLGTIGIPAGGPCGIVPAGLTGVAYDLATPNAASPPSLYVSDVFGTIAYLVAAPGPAVLAPPTFYTPSPCGASAIPVTDGLAYSAGGITYGTPRVSTTIETFGQSILGSTTFGVEITGTAPGTNVWAIVNYSFPGPGYLCPGAPAGGTTLWVDPGAPGLTILIGPLPPGCFAIPAGLPAAAALTGLNIFVQVVDVPFGGLPAVDASSGMAFTLTAP